MEFLNIKTLEDVYVLLEDMAKRRPLAFETVDLMNIAGRFLAEDVTAGFNIPEFDRSTVDGYAVNHEAVLGASETLPTMLTLVGSTIMGGENHLEIKSGEAVYVPTGAEIPKGATAVVMIEHCELLDEKTLLIKESLHRGENITYQGDDVSKGDLVLKRGRRLGALESALLAGLGRHEVNVFKKVLVSVLSTGDEVVEPAKVVQKGKIRDMNGYGICSAIIEDGMTIRHKYLVPDNYEQLRSVIQMELEEVDLVILSGGSSAGEKDYTSQVIQGLEGGQLFVHGLAVKPGKPTMIGSAKDKLIVGLPGHPSAAMLLYRLVIRAYFEKLMDTDYYRETMVQAILKTRLHGAPGKDTFAMVKLVKKQDGYEAIPIHGKSGLITVMADASGYIHIGRNQEGLLEGSKVSVQVISSQLIDRG